MGTPRLVKRPLTPFYYNLYNGGLKKHVMVINGIYMNICQPYELGVSENGAYNKP